MRLGLALLPADGERRAGADQRRAGDGRGGAARRAQAGAAASPISVVPLQRQRGRTRSPSRPWRAPGTVPLGQSVEVTVRVTEQTSAEGAHLRLFQDDALLAERDVPLQPGGNTFTFPVTRATKASTATAAGRARWTTAAAQNNEAAAAISRAEPAARADRGRAARRRRAVARALAAAHVDATVVSRRRRCRTRLIDLARLRQRWCWRTRPPGALARHACRRCRPMCATWGAGWSMIGGEDSFGAGGYLRSPLEEALPVSMDVQRPQPQGRRGPGAGGGQVGQHGPLPLRQQRRVPQHQHAARSGVAKVDIAKEAIVQSRRHAGARPTASASVTFDSLAQLGGAAAAGQPGAEPGRPDRRHQGRRATPTSSPACAPPPTRWRRATRRSST